MEKELSHINKGFSLVEIIVSISVFLLFVTVLSGIVVSTGKQIKNSGNDGRAAVLADEALEAVRNIRDINYASLSDGTFGLATSSNKWILNGPSDTTGIFNRKVTVSTVSATQKQISAAVTWTDQLSATNTVSFSTYLTNWSLITQIVGNWSTTTLAASIDLTGNNNGQKIQIVGNYAYIVRATGSSNFIIIDVTNPASPAVLRSLSLTGGLTNIFVLGNYAYISSDDDVGELKIVDITNKTSPSLVGTYDATGNGNGNGIYVVGNYVYLARTNSGANPDFLIINVSNPVSPSLVGSLNTAQIEYEVVVSGNYAYVASGDNNQELKIVNISTPSSPVLVGLYNLTGNTDSITIAMSGTTVLLGQGSILYALSTAASSTAPALLGSVSTIGTLNDIALNLGNTGKYVFIATSDNANEFKVIDITTPSTPTILGQRNITGNNPLLGAAYDSTFDRAFMVGQSDTEELDIIAPQ
ncbi:MAG: prepilin-type N-terminal cleavage/methylation domain-containing protein [Candidatus Taylorbacteria bacterium]|nr:prepilin-type N-terminal cleavage/methylation domain-containing protein [Candidatus Taylorbacteria bacterium]